MEITEEQRQRAEANRRAALEKRRRAEEAGLSNNPWRLFKCRKIPSPTHHPKPPPPPPPAPPAGFIVVLEICSPEEFSVTPEPLPGSSYPGEAECFRIIDDSISAVVPFRCIQSQGRQRGIYMLNDYEIVLRCLKKAKGVQLQDIPFRTRTVVQKFSQCIGDYWVPSVDGHRTDDQVNALLDKLPLSLRDSLLPYQLEGVQFGLRRGGRCLIADEMGLGKTIQAIAIASCFMEAGSVLVVCPAVLRFSWAEELEHWLPFLLPKDIHLVFGHQNNLDHLDVQPRVVVTSYKMLQRLHNSILARRWGVMIVDESHNLRCTKKKSESAETKAVLEVGKSINHVILLSGTPSLTRPYDIYHQVNILWPHLLGENKFEFAKNYCLKRLAQGCQGAVYKDFSKGYRLEELNVLLKQTIMIRRLKDHVLTQLPPKRRQIIRLLLKTADISMATKLAGINDRVMKDGEQNESVMQFSCRSEAVGDNKLDDFNECHDTNAIRTLKQLSSQEIGIAKLSGFRDWFSNHSRQREDDTINVDMGLCSQKTIIFAHHLKVLDGVQEFICEKEIKFVRIDGSTLARDRQTAVEAFRSHAEVKVAIIGITAGGVGLDFSAARNVVFVELPKSASEMLQAEDRAHRRGQSNAVNVYIFVAKGTSDESHWCHLNMSLFRVSSMVNGKVDAIKEIEVDEVFHLGHIGTSPSEVNLGICGDNLDACTEVLNKCVSMSQRASGPVCSSPTCSQENKDSFLQAEQTRPLILNDIRDEVSELVADHSVFIPEETLRFEVSRNTGRIHLYQCIPGKDSRPNPLSQSFRPEELESIFYSYKKSKNTTLQLLKDHPEYFGVLQRFLKEWNDLRPIQQNKLIGKPLQLPLSLELCYLSETSSHGCNGLLKGGSTRRVTPLADISGPLPENALLKKIALHGNPSKKNEYTQAWTISDEPLCKLCHAPCNKKLAKAPEYFEDLFCNFNCFQEYRMRISQKALRQELFKIEQGICTLCKLDCHKLVQQIKPLSVARRKAYIQKFVPKLAEKPRVFDKLINEPIEGNAWHADHIVPVYKGGGECRLENMRTLCVACHSEVTKAQQSERCAIRSRAKKQLKSVMKELKACSSSGLASIISEGFVPDKNPLEEDALLIEVPGSSYSMKEGPTADNPQRDDN